MQHDLRIYFTWGGMVSQKGVRVFLNYYITYYFCASEVVGPNLYISSKITEALNCC